MSSVAGETRSWAPRGLPGLSGRPFVGQAFDFLVIGGGLSLVAVALVLARPDAGSAVLSAGLAWAVFFANSAHFASSTVRLYTKPGARAAMPFLTMLLPVVMLAIVGACLAWPSALGVHLVRLYLTWSPYHYAAQAYGLAVMYSHRSGRALRPSEKRLLWWAAMLPFFHAFLVGDWVGLHWLLPAAWQVSPGVTAIVAAAHAVLPVVGFAGPFAWMLWTWSRPGGAVPLIVPILLVSNAAWWLLLPPIGAFAWATIFHGLQYLAIVIVFHLKERGAPLSAAWRPALGFYGICLALGWLLFAVLPWSGRAMGFGMVESVLVVTAAVNVHHFIVDAFIWRLRATDGNRRIVEGAAAAAG